jgi:RNA polymerase sigma-70 factor (ECF subfamily)
MLCITGVQDATVDDQGSRVDATYREQADRLWRALVGFTGDRELASDAVAEAFTRALRYEAEIRDLTSWVWRVAFRLAAAELRRPSPPEPDAKEADLDGNLPDLVRALRELPPKQRLAIVLHDYADRPTREVAAALGVSTATVRVHLSQGRRKLRGLLEERHA